MPTRIRGLVGTWSGKEASCVGREVLIKSIAQAVPTYSVSCFLLPAASRKKMRAVISNYWWGSAADSRRIHWQSWDKLTKPKVQGGMGFQDLKQFNLAMLGKQGWRLLTRPNSLCARVLKGRYFHDSDIMGARRKKHATFTWRAILAGRDVLSRGLVKRIGDGTSTMIWQDRLIPGHFGGHPLTPTDGQPMERVSDLLTASGIWNEQLIREIFFDVDAYAILKLPVYGREADFWAWEAEKHENYSVKSAYKLLDHDQNNGNNLSDASRSSEDEWKSTWKLDVPPKVRVFWWRVLHGFLPAKQVLHHRHVERVANYDMCGASEESIHHILIESTVARLFWAQTKELAGVKLPNLRLDSWASDLLMDSVC
ncbi:hypothetical protein PR202_ga21898 [Eleusine coracana subsp. coracana]|uniref:Reverse transcriptase zinc-binding domain-containing protein n=1 Tax=Eleusine coracana subsp. coracana TaxID=191504 RepID=A0AAV5D1M4_ELECO|nr:hypothetical protein PR202_ga21898 [Eleusine coracana subsp. coracana]